MERIPDLVSSDGGTSLGIPLAESCKAAMLACVFLIAAGRPHLPLCVQWTVPMLSKRLTILNMILSLRVSHLWTMSSRQNRRQIVTKGLISTELDDFDFLLCCE